MEPPITWRCSQWSNMAARSSISTAGCCLRIRQTPSTVISLPSGCRYGCRRGWCWPRPILRDVGYDLRQLGGMVCRQARRRAPHHRQARRILPPRRKCRRTRRARYYRRRVRAPSPRAAVKLSFSARPTTARPRSRSATARLPELPWFSFAAADRLRMQGDGQGQDAALGMGPDGIGTFLQGMSADDRRARRGRPVCQQSRRRSRAHVSAGLQAAEDRADFPRHHCERRRRSGCSIMASIIR